MPSIDQIDSKWDGLTCNCILYNEGRLCGQLAHWRNHRWPTGLFCDRHKASYQRFSVFGAGWEPVLQPNPRCPKCEGQGRYQINETNENNDVVGIMFVPCQCRWERS